MSNERMRRSKAMHTFHRTVRSAAGKVTRVPTHQHFKLPLCKLLLAYPEVPRQLHVYLGLLVLAGRW